MSCKGATMNAAASSWISILEWVRGKSQIDQIRSAKIQLRASVECLESSEKEIKADLSKIASKVKAAQKSNPRVRLDHLLVASRTKRQNLAVVSKKLNALQQHLMALENSEMNQKVFQSIKSTSTALKSMGLDKALESVDEVMYDMEESTNDISSIQAALSSSLSTEVNDVDEDDLQKELDLLMCDDDTMVCMPPVQNKMEKLKPKAKLEAVEEQPAETSVVQEEHQADTDAETEGGGEMVPVAL